ncbi:glycosyltransferase [Helcobacillus massiliensis]|uniref:glycosyltransferase n=1 Tax=Helcobacillus massiliensis TaxID=521392 RepID=UPI0025533F07|nr:glycosyltransferase [Helcobacillus massiliensis]MDK7742863.1 glycosyltransferase [Helcobacillus massiliensis]WOO94092.1 glycosyltransferase [Helcobacillus massiliensis]
MIIIRPRAAGGILSHIRDEHRMLTAAGHPTLDAGPTDDAIPASAIHHHGMPIGARPHPLRDLRAVLALRTLLGRSPSVAVHAHGVRAGALAVLARRGCAPERRGRLIVTLHNALPTRGVSAAVGAVLLRITARGADGILAVSPDLADAARAAGAEQVERAVIPAQRPGATDAPRDSEELASARRDGRDPNPSRGTDTDSEPLRLLMPARLAPQKDIPTALAAMALLKERGMGPVRLDIAGEGPLRHHLEQLIAGSGEEAHLLGHRTDLPALMADADVIVQSSAWEGQPVAIQEALHRGCAVIATDAGGTRWVTEDAALLVPPADPSALADAIVQMSDAAVRADFRLRALRRSHSLPGDADLLEQITRLLQLD